MLGFGCEKETAADYRQSYWVFGTHSYDKVDSKLKITEDPAGDLMTITLTTNGFGESYGAYTGSILSFTFRKDLGPGIYTLCGHNTLVLSDKEKLMEVQCVVGTEVNTGTVLYTSTDQYAGKAELSILSDGTRLLNITNAVWLDKLLETDGGIPGAKAEDRLTVKEAY